MFHVLLFHFTQCVTTMLPIMSNSKRWRQAGPAGPKTIPVPKSVRSIRSRAQSRLPCLSARSVSGLIASHVEIFG